MTRKKDDRLLLPNEQFNKWTVVREERIPNQSQRNYLCVCECGSEQTLNAQSLKQGRSKQCRRCAFHSHGMSKTEIYNIWGGIISRCTNPKVKIYKYYGGRGINVCERWQDFENFYKDMGERPIGLQIDRIDNDKGYSPENCHWVTAKQNNPSNKGTLKDEMPGKRFGKWAVLERVAHKPDHWYYLCKCGCGFEKIIAGGELRRGNTTQCMNCRRQPKKEKTD